MTRYPVSVPLGSLPFDPGRAQVVFHGINKSGSLAMANVLHKAFCHEGREHEFISHYHQGSYVVDMQAKVDAAPAGRSFVVGHALYGALTPGPYRIWATQFRHPLPRTISCYHWLKRKHEAKEGSPFASLREFVERGGGISHSQVAQLGVANGPRRSSRRKTLTAKNMLDISIDALEAHFSVIGIAERFEESIFAFAAACGLTSVAPWSKDDRNKGRPAISQIGPDDVKLIEEYYAADYALYEHALSLLDAQTQRLGFDETVLDTYRDVCKGQYKDRIL